MIANIRKLVVDLVARVRRGEIAEVDALRAVGFDVGVFVAHRRVEEGVVESVVHGVSVELLGIRRLGENRAVDLVEKRVGAALANRHIVADERPLFVNLDAVETRLATVGVHGGVGKKLQRVA